MTPEYRQARAEHSRLYWVWVETTRDYERGAASVEEVWAARVEWLAYRNVIDRVRP